MSRAWADEGFGLEALMRLLAAAGPRRAAFRESRTYGALDGALESTGHLMYRPGYLEKRTEWPQPERLEVDGERIVITAGNEAPRVIDLAMAPPLRVFIEAVRGPLSGDLGALRRGFACVVTGAVSSWVLTLIPKGGSGVLRSVRIEGHGAEVGRIAVVQANGDRSVMVISPA